MQCPHSPLLTLQGFATTPANVRLLPNQSESSYILCRHEFRNRVKRFALLLSALLCFLPVNAWSTLGDVNSTANVLVVVEGSTSFRSQAIARGRELATLFGHFNVKTRVLGVNEYVPQTFSRYDLVFYIGFTANYEPPARFQEDVLNSRTPVIWIDTGFKEFSRRPDVRKKFGFSVSHIDSISMFDVVRAGSRTFTKGETNINIVEVADRKKVTVVATAYSARKRWEVPYIISSGSLTYIADCPFASVTATDRYLYFADMLHDILGQQHEETHTALIRIEDVTPLEDPASLRDIADILSARNIPFLVGVIPFYVDPTQGTRVSLSDRPDLVDALRYMTENGGSIVMHGVTHQYRGTTAVDYEFWDENTEKPVKDETVDGISRKLESGIQEFMRNGLSPLIWETPHYAGSFKLYETIGKYFSTAMEQRLAIEDIDDGQYFPYIINRDLFGQRILPENLGYVPLDADPKVGERAVQEILDGAKSNLSVRDGYASNFFHAFVNHELLKEIVDGVQALGYTYMDVRDLLLWTRTQDRVILCGSQSYSLTLDDQYLQETTVNGDGEIVSSVTSEKRIKGMFTRSISLDPKQIYRAEAVEFRERTPSFAERLSGGTERLYKRFFGQPETWSDARAVILWDHHALGAAYNDQASFVSALRSVNIITDTIFSGQPVNLDGHNLLIVPFAFVDSLRDSDYDKILKFVNEGGNVITDMPTELSKELGIVSGRTRFRVFRVRDRLYPDERIIWRYPELATKFDAEEVDRVFAVDENTLAPLVVGKSMGSGKIIYFATRFDPHSKAGYSLYPYLLEYIGTYFHLGPVVRRDNLEVYFEPGSRTSQSVENLVKQWVRLGIRAIHVSGWHQYPKYTYDYQRLLTLAHANGILVYAWLEPPQVSAKFWTDHPEWREKNDRGEDVRPSWRYPVALTDPQCLQAMTAEYRRLLEQFDWDGVNIAELYFDAGHGFQEPHLFTPMHSSAQKDFRRKYGFSLASVLDSSSQWFWKANPEARRTVVEYRINVLETSYETILAMARSLAESRPGFQVIVTALDNLGAPELREYIGADINSVLALQRKFGFFLQVEDAERIWSTDPTRYIAIGNKYAGLLGDRSKLLLDLNIVPVRRADQVTPFPTIIQTGTESFHLVRAASLGAPRLTIYSESSINPQDLKFFPFAIASDVAYKRTPTGYDMASPESFTLKLPLETKSVRVDGVLLSASRDNSFLIPAGAHTVEFINDDGGTFSTHQLETRILSLNGNLLSAAYGMRTAAFTYVSGTRTWLALNREPTSVTVDGFDYPCAPVKGNDCYAIALPPGSHTVHLVTGDAFSYGINITSFWSSNAIAIFGSLAVLSLLAMYIALKFVRRRHA